MDYTQADLDAIKKAKASGALRVDLPSVGSVTYRSLAEMNTIQNEIQAEVDATAGVKRPRRVKVYASKDL